MIDTSNLPTLIGPRRRQALAERNDREKLAQAHMRRAKGPKKHSTNRERSLADRARAKKARAKSEQNYSDVEAFKTAVRSYWRGEKDAHP